MPRRPLRDLFVSSSARPQTSEYQSLTPRTPHSRSGRAEEAFTEVELEQLHEDDTEEQQFLSYRQQQSEPLLASSASTTFPDAGYRSRGDDERRSTKTGLEDLPGILYVLRNIPLIAGSALAIILFGLILLSIKKPETLERLVGASNPETAIPEAAPTPTYLDTEPPPGMRISYANYTKFPLSGADYVRECNKMMGGFMHHGAYWDAMPGGVMDVLHHDDVTDYHLPEGARTKVCSKTITYQLDGYVGLVADLALMAQAAALARERNRTFFVDDTYWNRGKWTDHFQDVRARQPGPERGCRSPPPEELVACPRHARHWVINSRTAKFHFGHGFSEEYEDPYSIELNRQRPIFQKSLDSFVQTIRPNSQNAALIRAARVEMASTLSLPPHKASTNGDTHPSENQSAEQQLTEHNPDPYIAVHIRKGDRHAGTFPNRGSYVPMANFVSSAKDTWSRLHGNDTSSDYPAPPITYLASDSPDAKKEFVGSFPSNTAIFSLDTSTEASLRALAPKAEYVQSEFNELDIDERIRQTRGMIVDLAMLSGLWAWEGDVVPGATICTLSSSICKVSALGLGFDRSFGFDDGTDHRMGHTNHEANRWIELDSRGIISPEWSAFDLF